ncbi:MAG: MBL fold metallo-hydrolase [Planctomycetota bacterium]|jgi:ribonuclease BN (tRNA processing enzyme)
MLTLTFLGVGSAFAKRNFPSNVLIEAWEKGPEDQHEPDDNLLVDFGASGPLALYELIHKPGFGYLSRGDKIYYPAIKHVFITHQHADHIGGLEEMAIMNMYVFADRETHKPHKAQLISSRSILVDLWDNSLKGGLSAMAGGYLLLQDYFFIRALQIGDREKDHFSLLKRYRFRPFPTDHIQIERKYDWPSFGLYIEDTQSGGSVFFSGDTRFDYPAYVKMLEQARICFHEVQLYDEPKPVHATLSELRTLPEAIRKKTWLYHYSDEWDSGPFDEVGQSFAGFAQPQQRYLLFD